MAFWMVFYFLLFRVFIPLLFNNYAIFNNLFYLLFFTMKNFIINNNGENPTNNIKKTKVESQIELLKKQEQVIIKDLSIAQIKEKKANKFLNHLSEVECFSADYLKGLVAVEKEQENFDIYWLESLIKNKVEFSLKFDSASRSFYELVWKKLEGQVSYLKRELNTIQTQLNHQERIFARIQAKRQGKILLECKLNNRLGCLGVYQCANCQSNYSDNQLETVATP